MADDCGLLVVALKILPQSQRQVFSKRQVQDFPRSDKRQKFSTSTRAAAFFCDAEISALTPSSVETRTISVDMVSLLLLELVVVDVCSDDEDISTTFFCVVTTTASISMGLSMTIDELVLSSETIVAEMSCSSSSTPGPVISFVITVMASWTISVMSSTTSVVPSVVVDVLMASSAALAASSAASFSRMALGLHRGFYCGFHADKKTS